MNSKIFFFEEARQVLDEWSNDVIQVNLFEKFCRESLQALKKKQKIIFFGNGGSAAEATHLAAEFIGKCVTDIGPLPALSLNDSISAITAIANDWDYSKIFRRQVEAHVRSGDLVIGLTTSGISPNVIQGLQLALKLGAKVSMWTSKKYLGEADDFDYIFRVPTESTPRAQEIHLMLGHYLAEYVAENWENA